MISLKEKIQMMLNNDDTELEQYSNYMASKLGKEILLNCEKCGRLFYRVLKIARYEFEHHKLFCKRCRLG